MKDRIRHARRTASSPVAELLEARRLFNAVTSLTLINAATNQPVQTLSNGATINLADFPANQINVRANTDNLGVESARFGLDTNTNFRVEDLSPYALFGDASGDFLGGTFSVGQHTITATSFSANGATGSAGTPVTVTFNVINQPTVTPVVTALDLINAQTDQVIKSLANGDTINLADFPANQLSIRADVAGTAKSVRFRLDANANFRTENAIPYVLFGDNVGDILGGTFSTGPHQVVATPFTGGNASGIAGTAKSITFNVINQPQTLEVTRLLLINADTDQVIQEIHDGDTFNRQTLPTLNLNVQAVTSGPTGSVRFGLDSNTNIRVENFDPYALFGDNGGNDFVAGAFTLGQHTLTATPFTEHNAVGTPGTAETVKFTFVDEPVTPQVTGLFLINADNQQVIQELHDGDMINQSDLPTQNLNVNAVVNGSTSSVKFGLDNNDNFRVESIAPYALFGDSSGSFLAGSFDASTHTITATPFADDNATGTAGDPFQVDFTIVAQT